MNTLSFIKIAIGFMIRIMILVLLTAICINLLNKAGISPFVAAFLIIFCRGLLRFIFRIVCLLVSAGILIWILSMIL